MFYFSVHLRGPVPGWVFSGRVQSWGAMGAEATPQGSPLWRLLADSIKRAFSGGQSGSCSPIPAASPGSPDAPKEEELEGCGGGGRRGSAYKTPMERSHFN